MQLLYVWAPPPLAGWSAPAWQWRLGGALLGCIPLAYGVLCALRAGRALTLRGHAFALPRWPVALWQMAASAGNWMLMGAALWATLQAQVSYPAALATVLLGAVAGLAPWFGGTPVSEGGPEPDLSVLGFLLPNQNQLGKFDALLGAIPWVGAIPDFFFRSNTRNLKLIKKHLDKHHPATAVIDQ